MSILGGSQDGSWQGSHIPIGRIGHYRYITLCHRLIAMHENSGETRLRQWEFTCGWWHRGAVWMALNLQYVPVQNVMECQLL